MKKWKAWILAAVMLIGGVFGAVGCSDSNEGVLTIRYYSGGLGEQWLVDSLEDYKAEHEGFAYKLIPDNNITWQAGMYMRGDDAPDIMMTTGGNWREYVARGYLEDLTDVYEADVTTSGGTKKVKDYLTDEAKDMYRMQRLYGQGENVPWAISWSVIPASLAYNETLLLQTVHTDSGYKVENLEVGQTWKEPPATVEALHAYIADINAANAGKAADERIVPFGWAGDSSNWFDFVLCNWWAQLQGLDEPNLWENEGAYYDFWNFGSAEVYKQTGLQQALGIIQSLIVDTETDSYINSPTDASSITSTDMEMSFAEGKIAVALTGGFFEHEMRDFLDGNKDGEPDYSIKMMPVPLAEGAQTNEDGSDRKLTYINLDEVMYIPAKATNKELAKDFLAFLCNEDQLLNFTKTTGCLRPFRYNPLELEPDYAWSDFRLSLYDLYFNCDDYVYKYPRNAQSVSPIYTYIQPGIFEGVDYSTIFQRLRTLTPEQIIISGADGYRSVYENVSVNYPRWELDLGL